MFHDKYLRTGNLLNKTFESTESALICIAILWKQETAESLQKAVEQARQIDESMKNISDTFSRVNLPKKKYQFTTATTTATTTTCHKIENLVDEALNY